MKRKSPEFEETLVCADCGVETKRTGPVQKYCKPCSLKHDLMRKNLWAHDHPRRSDVRNAECKIRRAKIHAIGAEISRKNRYKFESMRDIAIPDTIWEISVSVPFTMAMSKNHIYAMREIGHTELRMESVGAKSVLENCLRDAIEKSNPRVVPVQAKVWLDILVEKPDHKCDAVNVVDYICDAVSAAIGVDDRWFSIRRLDWVICKDNPLIFVGVGQEVSGNHQVCSTCGRILPLCKFVRNADAKMGVMRICSECRRTLRAVDRSFG